MTAPHLTNGASLGDLLFMDIRVIVFGMCFVLVALFVVAGRYIPRAKERSLKEADFTIAAQRFLKESNQENYEHCKKAAGALLSSRNSSSSIDDFLKNERIIFPKV